MRLYALTIHVNTELFCLSNWFLYISFERVIFTIIKLLIVGLYHAKNMCSHFNKNALLLAVLEDNQM